MGVALLAAKRSKDPDRQVGACIVKNKKILATGYNGFPWGCSDNVFPWMKNQKNPLDNKQMYVVHAELNAILNSGSSDLTGSTIYVDLFPCNECAKAIIQAGIKEVVYMSDEDSNKATYIASRNMLRIAGVKIRKFGNIDFIKRLKEV